MLQHFADRTEFFAETIELPVELGRVPCRLHGPAAGTSRVLEDEVEYRKRGDRTWVSRMCDRGIHHTRQVTVIGGVDADHAADGMILFTCYGGPLAPQEPDDPQVKDLEKSRAFWRDHALQV